MKNEIMTFKNEMFGEVRTMCDEKGEPWFCLTDVCAVLLLRAPDVKRRLDDGVVSTHIVKDTLGRNNSLNFINEDGLYDVILGSRVPEAKQFRKWVTSEVLPQIRKTGGYIPVKEEDDEMTILAKAVGILKRTVEQKEALIAVKDDIIAEQHVVLEEQTVVIEKQKPKVMFAEAVTCSDDCISIGDLAKLIASNGIEIGRARLFRWLRKHGYMFLRERRPKQEWVDKGLFEVEENVIDTGRKVWLDVTTKVTGKGQEYFVNGFVSGRFYIEQE